jgi:large subunit ribosomal protein L9
MKVILLHDVARIGQKFDIKEVANGYGRNYLIPRGLAKISTEKAIAGIAVLKSQHEAEKKIREDLLLKNFEDLDGVEITMQEKANDKGHLFAGIHKEEIIPAIKEQAHLDMDTEHIVLEHPIKELGEHSIEAKVGDKTVTFKLVVEQLPEEG